jgi:hypothetical protein
VIDAIKAYVGSGPALSDEERRAVRVVLKLHHLHAKVHGNDGSHVRCSTTDREVTDQAVSGLSLSLPRVILS